ncbi:MAG: (Fe-S)-binding protein [Alphaproteobacteria bacterium]|nr:(Fe-S)-binding protein [Alphaproteobacteria bacterium]
MADLGPKPNVALFVTCLVDLFRPSVGFAAVKLLEQAGCEVSVPQGQTCCGQPAYNSGDRANAAEIARRTLPTLAPFDYIVAPSGSCAGMIRKHWPALFVNEQEMSKIAIAVAEKTWELTSFLTDVRGMEAVEAEYDGVVAYHDSCSGLRELGVQDQPRKLLESVKGLTVKNLTHGQECCGFGGTFAVKYPDISGRMVSDKADDIEATGADTLLAGDLGCLMNMAGKLKRRGSAVKARHVAEILAGDTDTPPIGEGES